MPKTEYITTEERQELERLKDTDFTIKDIGEYIRRSTSLIKTEYSRGGGRYNYSCEKGQVEALKRQEKRKISYQFRQKNIHLLTIETRRKIENLKDSNLSAKAIADLIGHHKNSVNREFRLFSSRSLYNAASAQERADSIKKAKYQKLRKESAIPHTDTKEILIDRDATKEFIENKNKLVPYITSNIPDYIPKLPFKLWAERFKEENSKKRAYWTKEVRYFEFWIKHFGDKIAVTISPLEIETVSNELLARKSRLKAGTNLSYETRRKYLLMLSSIFTTAIKQWKWALFNPLSAVDTRRKEKESYTVYSKEKIELHDKVKSRLINNMKRIKEDERLTDRQLASKCGISLSIIQRVMNPIHNVTLKIVCKICTNLGIKLFLE